MYRTLDPVVPWSPSSDPNTGYGQMTLTGSLFCRLAWGRRELLEGGDLTVEHRMNHPNTEIKEKGEEDETNQAQGQKSHKQEHKKIEERKEEEKGSVLKLCKSVQSRGGE